jgi:hypothetical protein
MKPFLVVSLAAFALVIAAPGQAGPSWVENPTPTVAAPCPPAKTAAVAPTGIEWGLVPELGIGTTLVHSAQFTAALSLRLGRFGSEAPLVSNREFGIALGNVGASVCAGPWLGIMDIGDTRLRLGALVWKADRVTADLAVWVARPFSF